MTRILLIEDDDTIARGLAYSLEQEGWTVTCFGTLAGPRWKPAPLNCCWPMWACRTAAATTCAPPPKAGASR